MPTASPAWTCSWCRQSRSGPFYGLLILQHARRELLWLSVTAHPTAEWIARQLTEAYGWREAPLYLVRDRDRAYSIGFVRRVHAMGIRARPIGGSLAMAEWPCGKADRLDPP